MRPLLPFAMLSQALGVSAILCGVAWLFHAGASESRDWFFFFLLFAAAPLAQFALVPRYERALRWALVTWVAALTIATAFDFQSTMARSLSIPTSYLVALVAATLNSALCWRFAGWIARRFDVGKSAQFAAFAFVLCVLKSIDVAGAPFFFLQPRVGTGILILFGCLGYLSYRQSGRRLSTSRWLDWAWGAIFVWWSHVPYSGVSSVLAHHWSFYLGPIQAVKRGGVLLHDVPSQYGFLSILFPALLPWSTGDAFLVALSLALFAAAIATYRTLLAFPPLAQDRFTAGLLTLCSLYLVADGREDSLGVFAVPSASAYRYLWSYFLVLLLARERVSRPLIALTFAAGCLWSSESFVYCSLVLGVAVLAEIGARLQNGDNARAVVRAALRDWSIPPLAAAGAAVGVDILYRARFGFAPDWYAFFEYALAYRAGQVSVPVAIDFSGNGTVLIAFLAAACALAATAVKEGLPDKARTTAAVWAFFLATVTYYVSRSDPNTPAKLLALWFPLLCVGLQREEAREKAIWLPIVCAAGLLVVVSSLGDFPKLGARFFRIAVSRPWASIEPALKADRASEQRERLIARLSLAEPVIDLSGGLAEMPLDSSIYRVLAPATPAAAFEILAPGRQVEILRRHFARQPARSVQVVRREGQEETAISKALRVSHPVVVQVSDDEGTVIERYSFQK